MTEKKMQASNKLESQYREVFKELTTTLVPAPDNTSLAQPSPFPALPTVVTYGAYDEPIMGQSEFYHA